MIMKIQTDLVSNNIFNGSTKDSLRKHSQEYRVLATLRHLFPGKYETMLTGESPDLQDCINSIGIEVTAAVRENDMRAASTFSKLCRDINNQQLKDTIDKSGYSFVQSPVGGLSIATTGVSYGEKKCFQESIRKKKAKLQQYKANFEILGLAVILPEMPTSEAENHLPDWICEVFQEDDNLFDFVYVISHRFCIYYEIQTDSLQKWSLSKEVNCRLSTIARMTAEGILSLEDQEWQ